MQFLKYSINNIILNYISFFIFELLNFKINFFNLIKYDNNNILTKIIIYIFSGKYFFI